MPDRTAAHHPIHAKSIPHTQHLCWCRLRAVLRVVLSAVRFGPCSDCLYLTNGIHFDLSQESSEKILTGFLCTLRSLGEIPRQDGNGFDLDGLDRLVLARYI